MKTIILTCVLLTGLTFFSLLKAQNKMKFDLTLQAGINAVKGVKGNGDTKFDTKSGVPTIYIESHLYPLKNNDYLKNLGFGLGFGFYHVRTDDTDIGWLWTYSGDEVGALYWWPLYLTLKYNLSPNDKFTPYLKLDNGYNFFAASGNILIPDDRPYYQYSWGGYYMSLSGGLTLAKVLNIELSYSMLNSGIGTDYRYSGYWTYWDEDYKTKMLTLSFGLCF